MYQLGGPQVREQLGVLEAACRQLQASEAWVVLLQEILVTGNRLNAGTQRGSAVGAPPTVALKICRFIHPPCCLQDVSLSEPDADCSTAALP